MARIAGAADMGMSIGKLVASGNSAERRAAKSEFSGAGTSSSTGKSVGS